MPVAQEKIMHQFKALKYKIAKLKTVICKDTTDELLNEKFMHSVIKFDGEVQF